MDDALLVRVADRLGDLFEDRQEAPAVEERRQPVEHPVRDPFEVIRSGGTAAASGSVRSFSNCSSVSAADELHGEERSAVGEGPDAIDGRDAGVLEPAGDARLVDEPPRGGGVRRVLRQEDLDGDFAAEVEVEGAEDDAHAAAADLAEQTRTPAARRFRRHDVSCRHRVARVRVAWSGSGGWVRVGSDMRERSDGTI